MALLSKFDTPASVRDVPVGSPFYEAWSDELKARIGDLTPGDGGGAFYDPTATDVTVVGERRLTWMGFPRDVLLPNLRDDRMAAYEAADAFPATRQRQNEYFEWRVERNAAGKIHKVTFVTELRLYYQKLWNESPAAVVGLYRSLVSPAVQQADLTGPGGSYNTMNQWNTTQGIVHLIQSINTLPAAIGLAQGAVNSAAPFRDNYEARPGLFSATTSVDPRVSYDVHMLVRKGLRVTFRDPVGIYIADWNNAGITQPNGQAAPRSWWRVTRGAPGMAMRLEYEVPPERGFVVGDMTLGGRPIEYGAQLAEQVTVMVAGVAGIPNRGG